MQGTPRQLVGGKVTPSVSGSWPALSENVLQYIICLALCNHSGYYRLRTSLHKDLYSDGFCS